METYVISLKRSASRRSSFEARNPHLQFKYFDAIDGSQYPPETMLGKGVFSPGLPYTAGAYGCALSHLSLWAKAIESQVALTIAEDDAVFRSDFHEAQNRLLASIAGEWDIIVWAWNFDSILSLNIMPGISTVVASFNQRQMRSAVDNFVSSRETPALLKLDKCFGTPAYSISPIGAERLMSLCVPFDNYSVFFPGLNRALPNNGIDIALNRYYPSVNSFVCLPPLAVTKNEHEISTVQQFTHV